MKLVTYLPRCDWFIWLQIFLEAFFSGKRFLAYVSVADVSGFDTDLVTVVCWETAVGVKIFSGTIALGCLFGRFSTCRLEMAPSWGLLGRLGIVCWFSLLVLDSKSVSSFLLSLEGKVSVILHFFGYLNLPTSNDPNHPDVDRSCLRPSFSASHTTEPRFCLSHD